MAHLIVDRRKGGMEGEEREREREREREDGRGQGPFKDTLPVTSSNLSQFHNSY
jgi:hypothetical protein